MYLSDKEWQAGKDNFQDAVAVTRRQFLSGAVGAPAAAAAMYFGYGQLQGEPVRVGIIGTGDQANNAHIPQSNPEYIKFVAYSDIRPSSQKRAQRTFHDVYGAAASEIKLYPDYRDLLADPNVEMVIVVLPLHLHAQVTIDALRAGKHVLCEKLMAKTVMECKQMIREADKAKLLLAVGHQRHYSYLYQNCLALINREGKDVLGDINHIRAYWHRNQTNAGQPGAEKGLFDGWSPSIPYSDRSIDYKSYGYDSLEALIRWRLFKSTGGGLIVELGSHQLDACSIFLGKVHPVAVQGVGTKAFFTDGREVDDHIYLTYAFPDDFGVTYSSICTNAFDGYGEQVMGTKGTLIVQQEANAHVFKEGQAKDTRIKWAEGRVDRPAVAAGSTKAWGVGVGKAETLTSRGYREEQEHMAWLIRNPDKIDWPDPSNPEKEIDLRYFPRCHGRVALADAVIALSSNLAMKHQQRIPFKHEWFDVSSNDTPEALFDKGAVVGA